MARIPEAEIERLKNEIAVERLVTGAGIELKKSGKDQIGKCPFHDDAEPSLVVTATKNLWHCFGCQTGGGPIDWVMKMQGVSFRHAVELLREGISPLAAAAAGAVTPVKQSTVRKLPPPVTPDADDRALLKQVVGYYHDTLKQSPEALAYLQTRGLNHPEMIDRFKLGFANRTLGLRLPEKNRKSGEAMRTRLQRLGILRESGHEHFNGSLVIPVIDEQGNISEIYGRKIRDDLRPGTPSHLYLPGPHQGVWNIESFVPAREIILCEALIDALTFWCAGYRNVTTAYGVEGFTDEHLAAFGKHGIERVLIAYDRDDAGERAAEILAQRLMHEGLECYRIQFPHGMDANEYALKVTPAAKSLGVAIRKALWLGKGKAPARGQEIVYTDAPVVVLPSPLAAKPVLSTVEGEKTAPQSSQQNAPATEPPTAQEALPASPVPPSPAPEVDAQVSDAEIVMNFGDRRYRVRGLAKNLSYELLKVNLLAARGELFYVDTLDLYSAKQRQSYVTQAAIELQLKEEIIKADIGRVLLKLEALQEQNIRKAVRQQNLWVNFGSGSAPSL